MIRVALASLVAPLVAVAALHVPHRREPCTRSPSSHAYSPRHSRSARAHATADTCRTANLELYRWFGLSPSRSATASAAAAAILLPLALTMLLFLGPIVMSYVDGGWRQPSRLRIALSQGGAIRDKLLRDLVVGPTAEEWVFRACM